MPRIQVYDAPTQRLQPDQKGNEALTRAGRYVGQYYRQISTDYRDEGQLDAQTIKGRAWPFDILALQGQQLRESEAAAARSVGGAGSRSGGGRGGGGVNVKLGKDPYNGTGRAPPGNYGSGEDGGYTLDPASGGGVAIYDQFGQTSRGAAALGRAVGGGGLGSAGLPRQDSVIDPATGQDLNALTAAQVRANQLASAKSALSYEKERARLGGGIGNGANSGYNGSAAAAANVGPGDPNPGGMMYQNPGNYDSNGNPIPLPIPGPLSSPPVSDAQAIKDWSAAPPVGTDPSI